jgi:hypothetical protein
MKLTRTALGALVAAIAVSTAAAQATGGFKVRVLDASDKTPLPGVTVSLSNTQGFVAPTAALTDKDGIALFPVLRVGPGYVIDVFLPGYQRIRQGDLRVTSGPPVDLPIGLLSDQVEKVDVVAKRENVDLENTSTATKFSDEFIQDLPVQGRFYQNMLKLAPGVQDSDGDGNPNVQGARSRDFKATVNGVSNQDPLTGEWLSFVNSDSIEEVEIITAGAGAEYGRAQGGFGTIIQKQGSNDFEGVFNMTFRSSKLDGDGATNLPADRVPDFEWLQPSVQVSGPIVKDKLWYRLSHEYIHRDEPINTLNSIAVSTRTQTINADQITWQVSPKNKLAFQYQNDPFKVTNVGVSSRQGPESAYQYEQGGPNYTLSWTAPYSPKVLFDSLVSFQDSHVDIQPMTTGVPNSCVISSLGFVNDAQCANLDTGEVSGSYGVNWHDQRQRLTVRNQSTLYAGRFWGMNHQFKFGFSIENERYFRELDQAPNAFFFIVREPPDTGQDEEISEKAVLALNVSVPQLSFSRVVGTSWGIYGEDQIKPFSNLTATIGLRLDRELISSNGFLPFDPEGESQSFIDRFTAMTPDEQDIFGVQLVQETFTAYEGLSSFTSQLASILGYDPNLSASAQQSSFWQQTRRPGNVSLVNTNFAPRLSIAYDPWNDGKTKFALTAGRYYDKVFLGVPSVELEPVSIFLLYDAVHLGESWSITPNFDPINPALNLSVIDRNLRTPYKDEYTFSVERSLPWPETTMKVTYVRNQFRDQLQDIDLNKIPNDFGMCQISVIPGSPHLIPAPGTGTRIDPYTNQAYEDIDPGIGDGVLDDCSGRFEIAPGIPPGLNGLQALVPRADGVTDLYSLNPAWGSVFLVGNFNTADYTAYILELVRRQYRGWQLEGSYTYSRAVGDAEDFQLALGDDRTTLRDERGYLSYDQRHVVKVNATTITPWNFRLGLAARWQSGLPFSILEQNLSFDTLPPYYGSLGTPDPIVRTSYPTHQRNDQRNPSWWEFDVSFIKEMNLPHGMNLQLRADVFNLLNDDPLRVLVNIDGKNFAVRDFGRQFQLGGRLAF